MDDIPDARVDAILKALGDGIRPRLTGGGRYMLQIAGKRYINLVDRDGQPTRDGTFVYNYLGLEIPNDNVTDQGQTPVRRGGVEYIKNRRGEEVRYRTLQADGRTWKNTTAGREYDRVPHAEVIVRVPVILEGTNKQGNEYEREEWEPVTYPKVQGLDDIALNRNMSEAQKDIAIITSVKDQLGIRPGERVALGQTPSGEHKIYDHDREHQWKVSKMVTRPGENGSSVQTILNRPLGVLVNTSEIPFINQVLPESLEYHNDNLCVPRGIAALLKMENQYIKDLEMTTDKVAFSFDYLLGHKRWRKVGIPATDIERWCKDCGRAYYCIYKHGTRWRVKHVQTETRMGRSIAFAVDGPHAFFYKYAHILGNMVDSDTDVLETTQVSVGPEAPNDPIIQADFEVNNAPEVKEWLEWDGEIRPGYFYADTLT